MIMWCLKIKNKQWNSIVIVDISDVRNSAPLGQDVSQGNIILLFSSREFQFHFDASEMFMVHACV